MTKVLNIQGDELPKGWAIAPLEEICLIIMGQSPPSSTYNEEGEGLPFFQGKAEFGELYPIAKKYCSIPSKIAPQKSVLLSVRAPVGPTNIADVECCIGRGLAALVPQVGMTSEFILYLMRSIEQAVDSLGTGSTFKAIGKKVVENLNFALPPLNEQNRIVAKIEELFTELDEGVENLKKAKEQLGIYRQSLLKHAFEGKLTEKWRKENADKLESGEALLKRVKKEREDYFKKQLDQWEKDVTQWETEGKPGKKPAKPRKPKKLEPITEEELKELPELPDGWAWGRLGYMTCGVEYGTAAKSRKQGKYPVLRMGNIQECQFVYDDLVFTNDEEEYAKYKLKAGDVLFNRTNSPELVGKTAVYKDNRAAIFAGYLIRVNQIESVEDSDFLNYFLNSPIAKNRGDKVKSDGVNQSNINGAKLVEYPFPYCALDEQMQVSSLLIGRLTASIKLEEDMALRLQQCSTLRKAILEKAFSGKLIPQDSADEPASKLLEKIKQDRNSSPKTKRTQSRKTNQRGLYV